MPRLADQIDALLPQTQCGLCDYAGCRPYAQAIAFEQERIDKCLPGGIRVLNKLGELTGIDPQPYLEEMRQKAKPAQKVVIREETCIGCTKCIQACPVDAILGAAKSMHTVIAGECTGCELCIEPCPVDCIDIVAYPELSDDEQQNAANQFRTRYEARNARLARDQQEARAKHSKAKMPSQDQDAAQAARRAAIAAAIARTKAKKSNKP